MPSVYAIDIELQAWCLKWMGNSESAACDTTPKALTKADKSLYPNVHTLLMIAATLRVHTSGVCSRALDQHCAFIETSNAINSDQQQNECICHDVCASRISQLP